MEQPQRPRLQIKSETCALDEALIEQWCSDPKTFWPSDFYPECADAEPAALYDYHAHVMTPQNVDVLRLRFVATFFFDLISPNPNRISTEILQKVTSSIASRTRTDHRKYQIQKTANKLVIKGRRLDKLTQEFGNGILLGLPVDMSERVVCRMPLRSNKNLSLHVAADCGLDPATWEKYNQSATRLRKGQRDIGFAMKFEHCNSNQRHHRRIH